MPRMANVQYAFVKMALKLGMVSVTERALALPRYFILSSTSTQREYPERSTGRRQSRKDYGDVAEMERERGADAWR